MKSNEPSRTAIMIARQRAAHQVLDRGSILNDPFAMKILGEDEKDVPQFATAHALASIGRLFTAARSRIAEDALGKAVEGGVRQIVILGAGIDTFALRNPHGARQIRIYEVDHPATQAWKRQRLAEAQIELPSWLVFVPVDFEVDEIREKLAAAGFQQNLPLFHLARGCAISDGGRYRAHAGLHRVYSERGGGVRLYGISEEFSEELRQIEMKRAEQLEKIGERSCSRFEPSGMAALLRSHGFCGIEDIRYQEIASRFGGAIQGSRRDMLECMLYMRSANDSGGSGSWGGFGWHPNRSRHYARKLSNVNWRLSRTVRMGD